MSDKKFDLKKLPDNEAAALMLRDLANEIEAGEKIGFLLYEITTIEEPQPCDCGIPGCLKNGVKSMHLNRYNMTNAEISAACISTLSGAVKI